MPYGGRGPSGRARIGTWKSGGWAGSGWTRARSGARIIGSKFGRIGAVRGYSDAGSISRGRRRIAAAANPRTGGFSGIEVKFLDCAWNQVNVGSDNGWASCELAPSTGCTACISCPSQGDGESQRDGRRFVIKSVYVTGCIDNAASSDQADMLQTPGVFLALVLDMQANKTTIASEDVYVNNSTGTIAGAHPLRNLQNVSRFKILDSTYKVGVPVVAGTDGASTNSMMPSYRQPVKLSWSGDIAVNTTGTTADVASVADNAIHVVACAEDTTYTPQFVGQSRVRFVG